MTFDEKVFERSFLADLRKTICAAGRNNTSTSCNDEQAASSSTARKRPFSDTLHVGCSTSVDACKANNQYMWSQIQRGGDDSSLRLDDISTDLLCASASVHKAGGVGVAVKSPLALFDEFAELVYQSVDDDMKRRRNPFDDLAKGIYRDIDFPVSSEDNLLDSFVKNAYRSNEYGMAISEYGSTHESNWHSKFEELRKYKEVHGDCKV